jgi:hypothetical protein
MAWLDPPSTGNADEVKAAAQQIQHYPTGLEARCETTILFASSGAATIGFYTGSQLYNQAVDSTGLQLFIAPSYLAVTYLRVCWFNTAIRIAEAQIKRLGSSQTLIPAALMFKT